MVSFAGARPGATHSDASMTYSDVHRLVGVRPVELREESLREEPVGRLWPEVRHTDTRARAQAHRGQRPNAPTNQNESGRACTPSPTDRGGRGRGSLRLVAVAVVVIGFALEEEEEEG